ncbi:hypothetical protein MRB53_003356 [Persea americana]|uniref:Uncharacterized protein n=1 Tax=Persea americana TaxID=3435 RepID=A0ACC2MXE8_PERAE|nr:hypothetical protein MRB53_003356 [Persea americana]
MSSNSSGAFGKSICSICYEDLNPILEDLQAISICGHVFHELCLQQWLEYCPAGKKSSCPALRQEVKKLEMKFSGLNSAFEDQQQRLKELSSELALSKELAKKEEKLKENALIETVRCRQLLQMKTEELNRSSAECSRLQERSMNLAKELAALKLVSDVNLEEEEVLTLASVGGGSDMKQTIDILKKSLILRNKSYKELMTQCNLLGRGETRSLKKLEKADEKIKKLKTRLQELEKALEQKDNENLRTLKASKRTMEESNKTSAKSNPNPSPALKCSSEDVEEPYQSIHNPKTHTSLRINDSLNSKTNGIMFGCHEDLGVKTGKEAKDVIDLDLETDSFYWIDEDAQEISPIAPQQSGPEVLIQAKFCKVDNQKSGTSHSEASSGSHTEALVHGKSSPVGCFSSNNGTEIDGGYKLERATDEDELHVSNPSLAAEVLLPNIVLEKKPLLPIKRETPEGLEPIICPGNQCVPGGLGSEGAKKFAGKWCRQAQSKVSSSETSAGDLIAVGADGRGGRIKVLRAQNQLAGSGSPLWPKRCKHGAKQSGQSRGCLQIEHFFVKRES